MEATTNAAEVWKNTASGMRWAQTTDRHGKSVAKLVQPGKVFTITAFDRQVNQDSAATASQDLFRNGTFVLVKAAADTVLDEIESPDSLTDGEVQALIYDVLAKNVSVDEAIGNISSPIALSRILTALVIEEDVPKGVIEAVQKKFDLVEGGTRAKTERVLVTAAPEPEKVKTPRGGIPKADTAAFVKTEPEKVG